MNNNDLLAEFSSAQAILRGHFILSSGLHSDTYIQCARVLMDPKRAEKLCSALAKKITQKLGNNFADLIVSPAMGGVVVGYEMGRQLGIQTIFCERVNGEFELRRGFEIPTNSRILVVEDVITTGKSSLETYDAIKKYGGKVVAECALVDRSDTNDDIESKLAVPLISLVKINVTIFDDNNIPANLKDIPAIKPGSRFIK